MQYAKTLFAAECCFAAPNALFMYRSTMATTGSRCD
jgi:hypothetical protein